MRQLMTAERPWGVYHAGTELISTHETAVEAMTACAEDNERENDGYPTGHFYRTNASCATHRCNGVALTPDGLCDWHERRRMAELVEEAETEEEIVQ